MTTDERFFADFPEFTQELWVYLSKHVYRAFFRFEKGKSLISTALYKKRGKYAQPFLHSAMMALIFFGLILGPKFVRSSLAGDTVITDAVGGVGEVLGTSLDSTGLVTLESDKPRDSVVEYAVRDGDTLSSIAQKFDVSIESVKWVNEKVDWQKIKPGQTVNVPPVTGIVYKVRPGDTIYSIAEKFESNPQGIVDFPFNTFSDDESFAIVVGQTLIVPDGVMPDAAPATVPRYANVLTPDAGSVAASGSFVWPAFGRMTQPFRWYHKGIDIANKSGGSILAADGGTVVVSGWTNVGYGYHVIIDHGNGYQTLYGHMSSLSVVSGQRVARGAILGQMGSTGRSTGVHLHFEIRTGSGNVDPLGYLK